MTDILPSSCIKRFEVSGSDKKVEVYRRKNRDGWYEYSAFHGKEPLGMVQRSHCDYEQLDISDGRFIATVTMYFRACGSTLRETKP